MWLVAQAFQPANEYAQRFKKKDMHGNACSAHTLDLSQQIYDIREQLNMTCENLAQYAELTSATIKELEETNYDGDWDKAIQKTNLAFQTWMNKVIEPAHKAGRSKEYQVQRKAANVRSLSANVASRVREP